MLNQLKHLLFPRQALADGVSAAVANEREKSRGSKSHPMGDIEPDHTHVNRVDPLDPRSRTHGPDAHMLSVADYPTETATRTRADGTVFVGDSALYTADSTAVTGSGTGGVIKGHTSYGVPTSLMSWYASQSFIGYQAMSIISQHWLVDKACTMPGEDAVRNGYAVVINADAVNGAVLDSDTANEYVAKMQDADEDAGVNDQLIQFWRNTQIFGIRVAVFDVESDDPDYYSKPFNMDGVREGSYKGIRQVDPYWMMPILTGAEASNPVDPHFYDPSFWIIAGKKYHRSHLVIGRGPEVPDILKPSYIYGGVSLVQRIYERCYAAERTANEGPLLAVTKRTTVLKTNLAMAETQPNRFYGRIQKWTEMRDNYGVKTINTDDSVEQHDTSLADLDKTIMNQYQLAAAIAKVPSVKLLGTSPTGFGSEGTQETKSYHEHLESVQKFLSPFLRRHHELQARSMFGIDLPVSHTWNRVDSFTALELADLNLKKAQTDEILTVNVAAISPDEVRNRLKNDPLSGFGHLGNEEAATEIGATPENEQGQIDAGAKEMTAQAKVEAVDPGSNPDDNGPDGPGGGVADTTTMAGVAEELATIIRGLSGEYDPADVLGQVEQILTQATAQTSSNPTDEAGGRLQTIVNVIEEIVSIVQAASAARAKIAADVAPTVREELTEQAQGHRRVTDGSDAGLPATGGAQYSHRTMASRRVGRRTVTVENPRGSIRGGVDATGAQWRTQMPHDYGFFNNTRGADGEEVDVFVGPDESSRDVYIINQTNPATGEFDEHKVMLGFNSESEARKAYTDAFTPGWKGLASCWQCPDLNEWLAEDDLTLPYRELWHDTSFNS